MAKAIHRTQITGQDIAPNTIKELEIGAHAIGYTELTTGLQGSLGVSGIPAHSIGSTKLKNDTIGSQQIANHAVIGTKIANNAIGSQNLANASVPEYKLKDHYERGTITGVALLGRYKVFTTAFTGIPQVVLTPIGTYNASLVLTPALGSFKARVCTIAGLAGTANLQFMAWGQR